MAELEPDFDQVNNDLKGLKDHVLHVNNIETDIKEKLSNLVLQIQPEPFNPVSSIIIFGLRQNEGTTPQQ